MHAETDEVGDLCI